MGLKEKNLKQQSYLSGISKLPRKTAQMVELLNILSVFCLIKCVYLV